MELRHLRYFVAVAECGNIHVASTRLHVTQPAISRQIRYLEEEIGAALFERLPRGLKLTPVGELFLEESHKILLALSHALRTARSVAAGSRGQLKVSLVESVGWEGFVPDIVAQFQQSVPDVAIELSPNPTVFQLKALREGEVDGAFLYPFDPLPDFLAAIPLKAHDVVLTVPARWGFAPDIPVAAREMADRPFVAFPRHLQPQFHDRLFSACSSAGLTLRVVQEALTDTAVLSLVSAGIGAAILNSANRARPPVLAQFVNFSDVSIPLPFTFAYRRDNANPALARFIEVVEAVRNAIDAGEASARA